MILKDKVLKWMSDGVPADSGGYDKESESDIEETELVEFNDKNMKNKTFVEAVMFQLYFEGFVNSDTWDETEKGVIKIIEEKMELQIL